MSLSSVITGTIIGCLNVLLYTYLFAESFGDPMNIDHSYGKVTISHMPILGIQDPGTYAIICLFMSIFSILLVFGLVKQRPSLMWPWILAAFHVLGNYGYLALHCLLQWLTEVTIQCLDHECVAVVIAFFFQAVLYFIVFNIFTHLFIENLIRRYEVTRW